MTSRLWAVSCYFNPARTTRRLANYRVFRAQLDVPLLTVELDFGTPELDASDADLLIRIPGGDVLWQKERLLNVAIEALPEACDVVAWLDADVVFGDGAWPERARDALERFHLVRPFEAAIYAPPDFEPVHEPAAASAARALPLEPWAGDPTPGRLLPAKPWGKGWVARRRLIEGLGLYDACVVGGGDIAIAFAAFGLQDAACEILCLDSARSAHYRRWADAFAAAVDGRVGQLPGRAHHLWHGALEDRLYGERHKAFAGYGFDPETDLAEQGGSWAWASDKPDLHAFVQAYMTSRNEDGA